MFKSFVDGFREGYYGQLGKPVPKTTNKTSLSKRLGQWQAVTDRSQAHGAAMMQDPKFRTHFKVINWAITIAVCTAILMSVL
jgi:hypothetical protein